MFAVTSVTRGAFWEMATGPTSARHARLEQPRTGQRSGAQRHAVLA
jgi:hypothetical protein